MSESKGEENIKAYAVFTPGGDARPWSYPPRPLGDNDIEIKITHSGICHSDIHTMDQGQGWGTTNYPVVVGHEIVGHVVKKGKNVQYDIGDRVGVGAQADACLTSCLECKQGDDNFCRDCTFTYNGQYNDGHMSYGGYAERVRVSSHFAFKIPENIPSEFAAPLLCAGVTVYSPLKEHGVTKNTRVAITGLGGLGHLAVQFANKLGAHVTVISHSKNKQADAAKFGAHAFIDSSDKKQMNKAFRQFDLVLVTASYHGMDWNQLLTITRCRGKVVLVGAPEEDVHFMPFAVIGGNKNFCGSAIGSSSVVKEMLEFASRHEVRPMIQRLPMQQVNDGIELVRSGRVRYRVVLENRDGNRDHEELIAKQTKKKHNSMLVAFLPVVLMGLAKYYRSRRH